MEYVGNGNIPQDISERHLYPGDSTQLTADLSHSHHDTYGWFEKLLSSHFFQSCDVHTDHRKNECAFFCKDCCAPGLCQHCLMDHPQEHTTIQIRKYVYCHVVRVQDIQEHFDSTGVQSYTINSSRVVFLQDRPHSSSTKDGDAGRCMTCKRMLKDGCKYCSLSCKSAASLHGVRSDAMYLTTKRREMQIDESPCCSPEGARHWFPTLGCCSWKRRKQASPQRSPYS